VEEKNGSIVRRLTGYGRYEGQHAWKVMTALYSIARLYINFFQPSMKPVKKTRVGSKVSKQYDTARTPFERLRGLPRGKAQTQEVDLEGQFNSLDPVALLAEMARLQAKLWQVASNELEQPAPETASKRPKKAGSPGGTTSLIL
jgi:hypothetical protein